MRESGSSNSKTFSGAPPVSGDTQSVLCPSTSMILVSSGEKDMCAPPTTSGMSSGSPPDARTLIVRGFPDGHRKTIHSPSAVHWRK